MSGQLLQLHDSIRYTQDIPSIDISDSIEKELRKNFSCIGIKELEDSLRKEIDLYRKRTKKGYRRLSADIEEKIKDSIKNTNKFDVEKILEERVPSHTYISEFHKGRNICINYMNSLAFFFNISFLVNNFSLEP